MHFIGCFEMHRFLNLTRNDMYRGLTSRDGVPADIIAFGKPARELRAESRGN